MNEKEHVHYFRPHICIYYFNEVTHTVMQTNSQKTHKEPHQDSNQGNVKKSFTAV